MKILLIGKNGQVGAEIERLSSSQGHQVFSFDKQALDITQHTLVKEKLDKFKPEVVINTAAYHVVSDCEKYPSKSFDVNVFAVKNIAVLCQERNIKFVNYSTSWVFDGKKNKAYVETDIPNPTQIYGLSKLGGEIVSLNYNYKTLVIRTCGVFGGKAGSRSKKGNFVLYILNQAKTTKVLEISSEQTTSVAYAKDLATATLKLIETKNNNGIYHLVNEGSCSWAQFAQEIVNLKKLDLKIIPVNRKGVFKNIKNPIMASIKNTKAKSLNITLPLWKNALKRYLKSF